MTKKLLAVLIPMILIAVLIIAVVMFFPAEKDISKVVENQEVQPVTTLGATVIYVDGTVQYKQMDSGWFDITEQLDLVEGNAVRVLGTGKAIINLDDGSAVRLNSDSMITLSSLDPSKIIITNEQGDVYTRVAKADRIFEVVAKDVVYESLGTAYKTMNTDKENGVEVYHSKVKVKIDQEEVTVEEGNKYLLEEKKLVALNSEEIQKDEFVVWNKEQDSKTVTTEELGVLKNDDVKVTDEDEKISETVTPSSGITLTASAKSTGVYLSWNVSGVDTSNGYKIVRSTSTDPVYPGNDYQYITNSEQKAYTWNIQDGKTYYFRVCQYLGGKCGVYSNNVKVTAPTKTIEPQKETTTESGAVSSIALTAGLDGKVSWSTKGTSGQGFKIVWSKNSQPTYPTRSGDKYIYLSSPSATSTTVTPFSGDGTYYVRVCEYLGGKCGVYSNQVTVDLGSSTQEELAVSAISATANGSSVSWKTTGFSENGFKIVWSKNSLPTYPTRSGDQYIYLSSPSASSTTISAFDGEGTYYIRVCEYLGGKCGVYSNQLVVELAE